MRIHLSHVQINILVAAPPQCVGNLLFVLLELVESVPLGKRVPLYISAL